MKRLGKVFLIIGGLFLVTSCNSQPNLSVEEACEGALAFSLIPLDSSAQTKFENLIGDLDLSQSTDNEECGEYAMSAAEQMIQNAILEADMPQELVEFSHSIEWSTGQPAECHSFSVGITQRVCDTIVIWNDQSILVTWYANGVLHEIESDYGGSVDYQNPVKNCDGELWTLETCGGIFLSNSEYAYELDSSAQEFVKGIVAPCEPALTQYFVPVCDDYLPIGMDTLCGIDFCSE